MTAEVTGIQKVLCYSEQGGVWTLEVLGTEAPNKIKDGVDKPSTTTLGKVWWLVLLGFSLIAALSLVWSSYKVGSTVMQSRGVSGLAVP